ncbi:hypothetical protein GCM10009827_038300 [Dactylosporangium maewongense]|uniref:Transposase n=1 Tax=Dactylosporangium maewongense TaxID=634393 RepID=A0ABN2AK73_9ACTN
MADDKPATRTPDNPERTGPRLRMPGFVNDEDVGLGDVVKRVTSLFGVKPCAGCERRAAALNRWLAFTGRGGRGR